MNRRIALLIAFIGFNLMACCCGGGPRLPAQLDVQDVSEPPKVVDEGKKNQANYQVKMSVREGVRLCTVVFSRDPLAPAFVDQLLRSSIEKAVASDDSKDIVAMAFVGNRVMNSRQHSGSLFFRADKKKILTEDEDQGVKTSKHETDAYLVEVKEMKTARGIVPEKTSLWVCIVYPKKPSEIEAYEAIRAEIGKLANRGMEVHAGVYVGSEHVRTSWAPMKAKDRISVNAEYDPTSREIVRKNYLTKKHKSFGKVP